METQPSSAGVFRCFPAKQKTNLCVFVCVCAGMRQGNDIGTTYRSTIYTFTQQQLEEALASKDQYQKVLFLHFSPL